jgi:hypothetical protein
VLKGSTGLEYRLLHQIYRYGQRLEPMMRKLKAVEELTKKGLSQSEALEIVNDHALLDAEQTQSND